MKSQSTKSKPRQQRSKGKTAEELLNLKYVVTDKQKEMERSKEGEFVQKVMNESLCHALNENLGQSSREGKLLLAYNVQQEIAKVVNRLVSDKSAHGLTFEAQLKLRFYIGMCVMGNFQLRKMESLRKMSGDLFRRERRVMEFIESKNPVLYDEIMKVVHPEPSQPVTKPKKRGRPKREATPVTTSTEPVEQKTTLEDVESVTE